MKASELIRELEKAIKEHGDLQLYVNLEWTLMPVSAIRRIPKEETFSLLKEDGLIIG